MQRILHVQRLYRPQKFLRAHPKTADLGLCRKMHRVHPERSWIQRKLQKKRRKVHIFQTDSLDQKKEEKKKVRFFSYLTISVLFNS